MFKFLLTVLIIFFLLRIFGKYLLKAYLKRMQNNFGNNNKYSGQKREGDVTVNTKSQHKKKFKSSDGDYVDYEEIKD